MTFIHFIFDPVARQIEKDFPDIKRISVYAEPSYDDYSRVVIGHGKLSSLSRLYESMASCIFQHF
ncbi:hypothetical protein BLFGPEAP_01068 [Candidatus Methanoperedenaceae archaeon GB50]|nr:hypothetical protein BLFGPEAP_01068 [Candidatus Methanoperedenaceae archaeon GB50]